MSGSSPDKCVSYRAYAEQNSGSSPDFLVFIHFGSQKSREEPELLCSFFIFSFFSPFFQDFFPITFN